MGKSLPGKVGNINLRGKKTKLLGCGCCVVVNLRDEKMDRQIEREVRDELCRVETL